MVTTTCARCFLCNAPRPAKRCGTVFLSYWLVSLPKKLACNISQKIYASPTPGALLEHFRVLEKDPSVAIIGLLAWHRLVIARCHTGGQCLQPEACQCSEPCKIWKSEAPRKLACIMNNVITRNQGTGPFASSTENSVRVILGSYCASSSC